LCAFGFRTPIDRRLDELADDEETAWARVYAMIATRQPGEYDNAVRLLTDLQALAERDDRPHEFIQRCAVIRQEHARKTTLIGRLDHANL
jgi:predicted transcriptional regulator